VPDSTIGSKSSSTPKSLTTPRAAAAAGVAFALLFGASLILIRSSLPEGAEPGSQWLDAAGSKMKIAAMLMPFAGISFLWFIAVVRDNLGRLEDRFFSTVFLGSGLLFLAMMFVTSAIGAGLASSNGVVGHDQPGHAEVALFGQMTVLALSKTYALRMGAVFMMSLATIWLRTGLMPRWLVYVSYLLAVSLLIAGDISMWLTLGFPIWVLAVSLLLLTRAGVFEGLHDEHEP
jgi:hypothetical protein